MSCEHFRPLLDEFFDGELTVEKEGEVRIHLDTCADCTAEVASTDRLEDVLRKSLPNSDVPVDRYVQEVTSRVRRRKPWVPVLSAVAAAALLFGLMSVIQFPEAPPAGLNGLLSRYAGARGPERARIAKQIHRLGDDVIPDIVQALEDPSPKVQIAAAQLLGTYKSEKVRTLLLEFARKQDLAQQEWVLDEIGTEDSDNELVEAAFDLVTEKGETMRAVEVLRRLDRDGFNRDARIRIVDKLTELLKNSDAKVVKLALELVKELGIEFPVPALTGFLDVPELKDKALEILKRVTGKDFGFDRDAWDRYWAKRKGM